MSTLEPKLEILIFMQDHNLSATSNVNLLPTQSHSIKILLPNDYADITNNVIYESGYKLGSLWWEIGASLIATELVSLPSHYEKSINLHLQKFISKS